MKLKKIVTYVDQDTGEIMNERQRFVDVKFDEDKGFLFWNKRGFNRCFHGVKLPEAFNYNEKGRISDLQSYVWSNTNLLATRNRRGIRPFTENEIIEIMGLRDRQGRALVKKMIDYGIMAKNVNTTNMQSEECFYLSPLYFSSSNRINLNLYLLFRSQLDAVLPGWVIERFESQVKEAESKVSQG